MKKNPTNHRPRPTQRLTRILSIPSAALPSYSAFDPEIEGLLSNMRIRKQQGREACERLAVAQLLALFDESPEIKGAVERAEIDVQLLRPGLPELQAMMNGANSDLLALWNEA